MKVVRTPGPSRNRRRHVRQRPTRKRIAREGRDARRSSEATPVGRRILAVVLSLAVAAMFVPIAAPASSSADVEAASAASSRETAADAGQKPFSGTLDASAGDGAYAAALSCDESAGIPEGSTLSLAKLDGDAAETATARNAAAKEFDTVADDENLHVTALQAQAKDAGGGMVDLQADVTLTLETTQLAKGAVADSVRVLHVKNGTATVVAGPSKVTVNGDAATATFETGELGVFAIAYETESAVETADAKDSEGAQDAQSAGGAGDTKASVEDAAGDNDAATTASGAEEPTASDAAADAAASSDASSDDTPAAEDASTDAAADSGEFAGPVLTPEPLAATSADGVVAAELTYDESAGIPADATLSVESLDAASDEYATARGMAARALNGDASDASLSVGAFELVVRDAEGAEVEPTVACTVKLSYRLPDGAQTDTVRVMRLADGAVTTYATSANGATVANGVASAEFETPGLGTFAVACDLPAADDSSAGATDSGDSDSTAAATADSGDAADSNDVNAPTSDSGTSGELVGPVIANTQLSAATDSGDYSAQVSYGADAGIPEGASLSVSEVGKGSDDWNAAQAALGEDQQFKALDVHIQDADGNEVEPAEDAKVSVKIVANGLSEDAIPESVQVWHVKNGAAQVVAEAADASSSDGSASGAPTPARAPAAPGVAAQQDTSAASSVGTLSVENGTVTAEFETDSFSTFAITWSSYVTINVYYVDESGNEIQGTHTQNVTASSGTYEFSTYADTIDGYTYQEAHLNTASGSTVTCVTFSSSGSGANVVSTAKFDDTSGTSVSGGKKAGTGSASVYLVYKKNTSSGETVSDADATATSRGTDPAVTVKDTGNLKKLSGYHVVVENADSSYTNTENFLKAYHIYLADDGNNEVSSSDLMNGTLNLQVTLTYSTLPDWFEQAKDVKHFKEGSAQVINNVKFDSSTKTITFIVHGFSDFVISSSGSTTTGGGTTVTTEGSSILDGMTFNDANEWQIVSGQYAGNSKANKTESPDGKVRIQKNVIPTGTENEFYVYLSIDRKETQITETDYENYFAGAAYSAVTSNNYHSDQLGTIVGHMGGSNVNVSGQAQDGYDNSATFIIKDPDGNPLASNVTLYWDKANNVTFDLKLGDGRYVLMGLSVKNGDKDHEVRLSSEAWTQIKKDIQSSSTFTSTVLNKVEDKLGAGFEFVEADSSSDGTVTNSSGTLTWTINPKTTFGTESESTSSGSSTHTTTTTETWDLNVAELLYKVKYTPTQSAGLDASTNALETVSTPTSYNNTATAKAAVNESATLTYDGSPTTTFPIPEVRGMLYEIKATKIESDKKQALADATFGLYTDASCSSTAKDTNGNAITAKSDSNGVIDFTNLQYGTYYVKETDPPSSDYTVDSSVGGPYTTCYTTNSSALLGQGTSEEALYKGDGTNNSVKTFEDSKKISLPVTGGSGSPLAMIVAGAIIGGATVAYAVYIALRDPRRKRKTLAGGGRRG